MDITVIEGLITSLGFPIALVIAMGFFIWKIYQQSVKREEKLITEIAECRKVNDKAIETLSEKNVEIILNTSFLKTNKKRDCGKIPQSFLFYSILRNRK